MKYLLPITCVYVALLLAITPAAGLPQAPSGPPPAGSLGWFEFWDIDASGKYCHGCYNCSVTFGGGALGCSSDAVIGNQRCVDLNGRRSANNCDGVLTVDFASTATGSTPVHYTAANQTYVGGNAPNKESETSFDYQESGTGTWGSTQYVGSRCVASIMQYQKATPSDPMTSTTAQYSYNISIFDNDTPPKWIGGTSSKIFIQDGMTAGIDSALPQVFEITSASLDHQPYTVKYNNPYLPNPSDQVFSAYDAQCMESDLEPDGGAGQMWGYDSGGRWNNCAFSC